MLSSRMVVSLRIEIEICVGELLGQSVPQRSIWFSVYCNVKCRWLFDTVSMVNWMLRWMLFRW